MAPQPSVAVFGAAGHTGRFIVQELLRRNVQPIAVVRDLASIETSVPQREVVWRSASVDDNDSLDAAFREAGAVINCAGPFLETADAVVKAALRSGLHYLDVSAEQQSVREVLDTCDSAAREASIAVIPGMGFYGGFADLLATAALGDWTEADTIDILIGLDSWHPTRGTRTTGAKNKAPRVVMSGGHLAPLQIPAAEKDWNFDGLPGHQTVVEVPFSEVILISRHIQTRELHTWLSRNALDDIRNPETPAPQPADATGRSAQRFTVEAVVRRQEKERRAIARGQDIYAFSAALICEAATRLIEGRYTGPGAQPPSVLFNVQDFLSSLSPEHLAFEIVSE